MLNFYLGLALGSDTVDGRLEVIRLVGIAVTVIVEAEVVETSPVVRQHACLAYAQYRFFTFSHVKTKFTS